MNKNIIAGVARRIEHLICATPLPQLPAANSVNSVDHFQYALYLPDKELLQDKLREWIDE